MSHVTRKPVFGVSDQVQVQHKLGCSATGEILDLESRGIVLFM